MSPPVVLHAVDAFDRALLERIENLRSDRINALFRFSSKRLPRSVPVAAVGGVAWLRTRDPRPVTVALSAALSAQVLGLALRSLVGRRRPAYRRDVAVTAVETTPRSSSFPSTHAANGFAAAVALGAAVPRYRFALLSGAAITSCSRVWLGVHHPSDVFGGAVLGALVGSIAARRWARSADAAASPADVREVRPAG